MKTRIILFLLLAIATPCCLGQVYRTVDSPKVYGESADNKADHYNVRLTAENTYITRAERDFKNTDNFYLSTNSYLVDKATGKHYNFRENNRSSVAVTWGGDRVTLPQTDTSTYSATGYTSRGNLTIKAMRSSRNGQIYLVTVSMPNPTPGVSHITINFKP